MTVFDHQVDFQARASLLPPRFGIFYSLLSLFGCLLKDVVNMEELSERLRYFQSLGKSLSWRGRALIISAKAVLVRS